MKKSCSLYSHFHSRSASSDHSDRSFQMNYYQKYGTFYYKKYEKGDEQARFAPRRENDGLWYLQTYEKANSGEVYQFDPLTGELGFVFCDRVRIQSHCGGYGRNWGICPDCQEYNSTSWVGISIPLCMDDWNVLRMYLMKEEGWSGMSVYHWICFWKEQFDTRYQRDGIIVFERPKFGVFDMKHVYHFFQYLFHFIKKRQHRQPYSEWDYYRHCELRNRSIRWVDDDRLQVYSANAFIKLSIETYQQGNMIDVVRTKYRHFTEVTIRKMSKVHVSSPDFFTLPWVSEGKKIHQQWFSLVCKQINEEVRYRPFMVGYEECKDHFDSCPF